MNMLSFYGGPAGKDFTIAKVFPNKAAMDADVALGNDSTIYAGDYVLISYGDPNSPKFAENLTADGDTSYNATLWKKEWNNGYSYREIVSVASSYPKFAAGSIEASLPFGEAPQLSIDSSSLANPKIGLKMPASLVAGTTNTTESGTPTEAASVTPVYGGTLGNELSFQIKIPRGVTFTPNLTDAGVISWTNDGGLVNPAPVSVKGPKGDTGISFAGIEYTPSTTSGGNNTFKVKYSNGTTGTESHNIRNGVDITNVEETAKAGVSYKIGNWVDFQICKNIHTGDLDKTRKLEYVTSHNEKLLIRPYELPLLNLKSREGAINKYENLKCNIRYFQNDKKIPHSHAKKLRNLYSSGQEVVNEFAAFLASRGWKMPDGTVNMYTEDNQALWYDALELFDCFEVVDNEKIQKEETGNGDL